MVILMEVIDNKFGPFRDLGISNFDANSDGNFEDK